MRGLFARLFLFFLFLLAGAVLGGFTGGSYGAVLGTLLGAFACFLREETRLQHLLRWLRRLQDAPENLEAVPLPHVSGVWLEATQRVYRLLRWQRRKQRESDARLENLQSALEASPNGVIVLDQSTRIEWCNRRACQHFGLDARRDIAQRVTHLLRDPVFVAYLGAGDFSEPVLLARPANNNAGNAFQRLSVQIYPYGDGRLLLLSVDITLREQLETMRRDFVANVSHEIRTPLSVLTGFIETLQTLLLSEEERQRYLEWMARQAERMQDLVQDLLTLSRLEEDPPPGLEERTSVRQLLADCATDARSLAEHLAREKESAPQELLFPAAEEVGKDEIAGVAGELASAFANLVNNAIRYTPPGGRIEIRWKRQPDGGAAFSVQDSGPGIAAEHIPRLTERFYRVDSSRSRESGGTGLGLSIVKHILQRHDATLEITSTLGQGACFTATFPAFRIREPGDGEAV
ncbi:MAG: phosphate regulon sensor histidine kinase PhoR [Zoogloeaceae bacterium]|jgi:two-component system phosphate regulon sensor histidine kinase PhoR|nr:phosphate regulon sensor histidine kinase PhoR [Zoogloeaceae bacterium]